MAINFALLVYLPCFQAFARPVTIIPVSSQPGGPPYNARGIFDTEELDIDALDGSIYSSTRTVLDILQSEFPVLPMQDDRVSIPPHEMVRGGEFIISDVNKGNAGGEVTLRLKRLVVPQLVGAAC